MPRPHTPFCVAEMLGGHLHSVLPMDASGPGLCQDIERSGSYQPSLSESQTLHKPRSRGALKEAARAPQPPKGGRRPPVHLITRMRVLTGPGAAGLRRASSDFSASFGSQKGFGGPALGPLKAGRSLGRSGSATIDRSGGWGGGTLSQGL